MPKYLLTSLLFLGAANAALAAPPLTTGYLEHVKLLDAGLEYDAKLDTGADTTSINAEIISFDKAADGTLKKVKFKLADKQGNQKTLEKEVVRVATIKGMQGRQIIRPVVNMQICIEDRLIEGEVNLADRRQFDYQLLIGRNMIGMGNLLVDSSQKFLTQPDCQPKPAEPELQPEVKPDAALAPEVVPEDKAVKPE